MKTDELRIEDCPLHGHWAGWDWRVRGDSTKKRDCESNPLVWEILCNGTVYAAGDAFGSANLGKRICLSVIRGLIFEAQDGFVE